MSDVYAVIGNPIEHSRSPQIHALFARQTGQDIEYGKILGEDFEHDVQAFFSQPQAGGLNVTVPFKERAYALCNSLTGRAQAAGAVNTLLNRGTDGLHGDNTDGVGLVTDLGCNQLFAFAGSRVLLLGAGGAARGVVRPLLQQQPASLVIANRTAHKAELLAQDNAAHGTVTGCGLGQLAGQVFDLIINATASGLTGEVPAMPADCLADGGWVYDMMYAAAPTAFVRWGQANGAARALDGLGMLVEQAAESFYLWRGVRPETSSVITQLRKSLQSA